MIYLYVSIHRYLDIYMITFVCVYLLYGPRSHATRPRAGSFISLLLLYIDRYVCVYIDILI